MTDRTSDRIGDRLKTISADLKNYIEKRAELLLLNIGEQVSGWMAETTHRLTGIFLLFGGFSFLLVALAIYLGELLGNRSLGYVLVSVPLLVLGFLFYFLKPKSMLESLKDRFEEDFIEALSQNGREGESDDQPRLADGQNEKTV